MGGAESADEGGNVLRTGQGSNKKFPCPFALTHLPHFKSHGSESDKPGNLGLIERLSEENPENVKFSQDVVDGLKNQLESLEKMVEEQENILSQRLQDLSGLLLEKFGITDAEAWVAEQNEMVKNKEAKPITLTIPTEVVGKPSAPTTLRIKLVDDSRRGSQGNAQAGRGAGSKNLSRMNRPAEATGGAETAKAKAVNQIPIHVFWNHVEAFFKPIDDVDLKFLGDSTRIIDPTSFVIPPLGKPYLEQWQQQYGYVRGGAAPGEKLPRLLVSSAEQFQPSLKERLLSLLIDAKIPTPPPSQGDGGSVPEEDEAIPFVETNEALPLGQPFDYLQIDDRIRQDLAAIGLEEFAGGSVNYNEDDPICVELRSLQSQLQKQLAINYYRKRKLSELAKSKLAAQEFYSLLSDIDKQLEQIYMKRNKTGKKKKKGGASGSAVNESPTPGGTTAPAEAIKLLETRSKLLTSFHPYIPKLSQYLNAEAEQLIVAEEETNVLQACQDTGTWFPMPNASIQTEFSRPISSAQLIFPPS